MRLRSTRLTAIANAVRNKFYGAALNLRFDNTSTLDPRITFSRTSNATLTNSAGVLTYAPHNLLTFSEQFDNAAWGKSGSSVTANSTAAPDGSTTADKLVEDTSSGGHRVAFASGANSTIFYAYSVFIKAAERNWARLLLDDTGNGVEAYFDLTNGAVGSVNNVGTATGASATIASVGGGWYRCTLLGRPAASNVSGARAFVGTAPDNNVGTFTGIAGNGVFLWGAQLNVGALQPYYPTTVKNLLGYTQEFDNAAWTKSNSFVQTNQIRNNTMQGAVAGTPGTTPTNWSIVSGGGISRQIVSTGTEAGISYIDVRFFGTGSSVAAQRVYLESTATVPAATGQSWALSAYVKLVSGTSPAGLFIGFDETGPGTTYIKTDQTSLSVTDALLRYVYSAALTGGANVAFILPQIGFNSAVGVAVDFTLRIGLPQLVQGASAGDVVATYGTARAVMYTAPDGSVTADKLVEGTATAVHQTEEISSTSVSGTVYRYSIRLKAAERTRARIVLLFGGTNGVLADANLSAGTIGAAAAFNTAVAGTSSIQDIGNGWYLCSVSGSSTTGTALQARIELLDPAGNRSYTGDGTSGVFVWGAQISDSASLDPYVYQPVAAPASTAYYGPRFDYDPVTLAPRGLLIEEQRTNLITNSQNITLATWGSSGNVTTTASSGISPDKTQNATAVMETTVNGSHTIGQTFTVAANTNYAASIYLKANGRDQAVVYYGMSGAPFTRIGIRVDLSTGLFVNSDVGTPSSVAVRSLTPVGDGWYRVVLAGIAETTFTTGLLEVSFYNGTTSSYAGDPTKGMFVWGAQLETGAFATSYIPTTTAAATRAADVATMIGANFSNWYNVANGAIFVDYATMQQSGFPSITSASDGTNNNRIQLSHISAARRVVVTSGGSAQWDTQGGVLGSTSSGVFAKFALAYAASNYASAVNGGTPETQISGSVPVGLNRLTVGADGASSNFLNGHIRRIAYYNRRLTNTELQGITS